MKLPLQLAERNWSELQKKLLLHKLTRLPAGHRFGDALTTLIQMAADTEERQNEFDPFSAPESIRVIIGLSASGENGFGLVEAPVTEARDIRDYYSTLPLRLKEGARETGVDSNRFQRSDDLIIWHEFTGFSLLQVTKSLRLPVKRRGKQNR